jgi:hypothetical protein
MTITELFKGSAHAAIAASLSFVVVPETAEATSVASATEMQQARDRREARQERRAQRPSPC